MNGPDVAHRLDDVAGAGLALGADHRGALADPAECLAQVPRSADEGNLELVLVDVVGLVGRREHLGLVDVVDPERLEDLGFDEMPDARLGHDRDRDRAHDPLDHGWVAHASDAARRANVCRDALERHHGNRTGFFRDLRLLGRDDVHDDAALEHPGEALLGRPGRCFRGHGRAGFLWSDAVLPVSTCRGSPARSSRVGWQKAVGLSHASCEPPQGAIGRS